MAKKAQVLSSDEKAELDYWVKSARRRGIRNLLSRALLRVAQAYIALDRNRNIVLDTAADLCAEWETHGKDVEGKELELLKAVRATRT